MQKEKAMLPDWREKGARDRGEEVLERGVRERETERQRERYRETDRDRETDRQTETERQKQTRGYIEGAKGVERGEDMREREREG